MQVWGFTSLFEERGGDTASHLEISPPRQQSERKNFFCKDVRYTSGLAVLYVVVTLLQQSGIDGRIPEKKNNSGQTTLNSRMRILKKTETKSG